MNHRYLEVTYRRGKPLAAYLYLPRQEGDRSASVRIVDASINVDVTSDGRPIGIEILDPARITTAQINAVLTQLNLPRLETADLAPLAVA